MTYKLEDLEPDIKVVSKSDNVKQKVTTKVSSKPQKTIKKKNDKYLENLNKIIITFISIILCILLLGILIKIFQLMF